jgi:hypothetical protein
MKVWYKRKEKSDGVSTNSKSIMLLWNGKKFINEISDEKTNKNILGIKKWYQRSRWMIDMIHAMMKWRNLDFWQKIQTD